MKIPCDDSDRNLFATTTRISLGDGKMTKFWYSARLDEVAPKDLTPMIFEISKSKNQTVASALQNRHWVQDINILRGLTIHHIRQFVGLWTIINQIHLAHGTLDEISWKLTPKGTYSSKSAYALHFLGSIATNFRTLIWKTHAPAVQILRMVGNPK